MKNVIKKVDEKLKKKLKLKKIRQMLNVIENRRKTLDKR